LGHYATSLGSRNGNQLLTEISVQTDMHTSSGFSHTCFSTAPSMNLTGDGLKGLLVWTVWCHIWCHCQSQINTSY